MMSVAISKSMLKLPLFGVLIWTFAMSPAFAEGGAILRHFWSFSEYPATAQDSVVLARVVRYESIRDRDDCPKDTWCFNSPWRYELQIEQLISGPALAGRISAVRYEHGPRRIPEKAVLFKLRPFEDEKRARFGADFYLGDGSFTREVYCEGKKADESGPAVKPDEPFSEAMRAYCSSQ